jgi:predicted HD phosphohydrolase
VTRAQFTRMQDSTAADWQVIASDFIPFSKALPERVLAHLKILEGDYGGFPVDRYTHSLQAATRALRDGRGEEYIVCALLHDIGDTLGSYNHADIAAAILKPFISEENHWMIQHHAVFQGNYFFHHIGMDRDMREQFRGHIHFARTEEFCALYDNPAFDPNGETLSIGEFEPMVRRVFAQPRNTIYKAALNKGT